MRPMKLHVPSHCTSVKPPGVVPTPLKAAAGWTDDGDGDDDDDDDDDDDGDEDNDEDEDDEEEASVMVASDDEAAEEAAEAAVAARTDSRCRRSQAMIVSAKSSDSLRKSIWRTGAMPKRCRIMLMLCARGPARKYVTRMQTNDGREISGVETNIFDNFLCAQNKKMQIFMCVAENGDNFLQQKCLVIRVHI